MYFRCWVRDERDSEGIALGCWWIHAPSYITEFYAQLRALLIVGAPYNVKTFFEIAFCPCWPLPFFWDVTYDPFRTFSLTFRVVDCERLSSL